MWKVLIFLNIGILHCTVFSSPPSPINVTFSSVNLRNVLHWSPGIGTPLEAHYTVQYAIYGDSVPGSKGKRVHWRSVRLCTEIVRNWCDLTNQTWDLEHGYHAKVRAVGRKGTSKWALTQSRFDPKIDTDFGPPLVSVEIKDNTAIITMKGPNRYLPNNQTPAVPMATIYPQMTYNLSVLNTHSDQIRHFSVVSHKYTYHLLDYSTEYCFSARTRFLAMPTRCLPSAWHCITTPEDPVITQLKRIIVGIVVPSVCICFLVVGGYILYHYLMGTDQKSPLDPPPFHPPHPTIPSDNLKISIITPILDKLPLDTNGQISDPISIRQPLHNSDPPPSYTRQSPETPPPPEDLQDELPVEYGCVGVNPEVIIGGEEENMILRCEGGEGGARLNETDAENHNYNKQEQEVKEEFCTRMNALQSSPYHSQMSSKPELSTLAQAQAWPQMNPVLLNHTQESVRPFQGANRGAIDQESEKCSGLFLNKNPQTGLFDLALNLLTSSEGNMEEEVKGKVMGRRTDGDEEEGRESETAALLSGYASQNIRAMPAPHCQQLELLPYDYDVMRSAKMQEKEGEGAFNVKWDAESRIVFPKVDFREEAGSDQLEPKMEMLHREEVNRELRLENVFIRQQSEEEAGGQVTKETGEEGDILTKWNLVIPMDW